MSQPLPDKTIFFESDTALTFEVGRQIQAVIDKKFPGWNTVILDDGIHLASVHGPALPLEDWVDGVGARQMMKEFEIHAASAEPADFPRLAMISIRQWLEQKQAEGGRRR